MAKAVDHHFPGVGIPVLQHSHWTAKISWVTGPGWG